MLSVIHLKTTMSKAIVLNQRNNKWYFLSYLLYSINCCQIFNTNPKQKKINTVAVQTTSTLDELNQNPALIIITVI